MMFTRQWIVHVIQLESTIIAVECGAPLLSDLDSFTYLTGNWIGIFVEDLSTLPVDDMILLCNVVCYGGLVELTCRLFSV